MPAMRPRASSSAADWRTIHVPGRRLIGAGGFSAGSEPEYYLGARLARPSGPARAALFRARVFAIASTTLLVLTLVHLLTR